jgi:NAD(P)-dependent dehydrogenase (short-subunit alcohol dehydrogenase family)
MGRLAGKCGIVVGGGQTPGATLGNGRASALLFAREGARVLVVDRNATSAEETAAMIREEGGEASAHAADWTELAACEAYVSACVARWGALDFLHNNVGTLAGDAPLAALDEDAYDTILRVNLRGCVMSCKAATPVMRAAGAGSIVNISSVAALTAGPATAYKLSKAAINALTQNLAVESAPFGVRVNAVLPGLLDTPMAIEGAAARSGMAPEAVREARDRAVRLRGRMGTAWDTAYASLFLHSDEAAFITGVALPVDGGGAAHGGGGGRG